MKLPFALLMACSVLGFAGCDTLDDASASVRDRFAARAEPKSKTFSAGPRPTFEAVKAAAASMGYRMTRGGAAQGVYEGVSGVMSGETRDSARQVGLKVRLRGTLDDTNTEVSVRFTEMLESNSGSGRGMTTETTMRDTPLYEVFFRNVQQALGGRESAKSVAPAVNP